jgi:NAD-dependent deacetylase
LPHETLRAAQQATLSCDVMLVIGTSLEVMPAADLPLLAQRRGGRVILINRTATFLDRQADAVIRSDVVKGLKELWEAVMG